MHINKTPYYYDAVRDTHAGHIISGPFRNPVANHVNDDLVSYGANGAFKIERSIHETYPNMREYLSQDPLKRSILLQLEDGRTFNDKPFLVTVWDRNNGHKYPSEKDHMLEREYHTARLTAEEPIIQRFSIAMLNNKTPFMRPQLPPFSSLIYWDPTVGIMTSHGAQSPAFGLAHELDHAFYNAYDSEAASALTHQSDQQFDDAEERRVIERDNASTHYLIEEAPRYSHIGVPFRAESSTSTSGDISPLLRTDARMLAQSHYEASQNYHSSNS